MEAKKVSQLYLYYLVQDSSKIINFSLSLYQSDGIIHLIETVRAGEDYTHIYDSLPPSTAFRIEDVLSASTRLVNSITITPYSEIVPNEGQCHSIPIQLIEIGHFLFATIEKSFNLVPKTENPSLNFRSKLEIKYKSMTGPFDNDSNDAIWFFTRLFQLSLEQQYLGTLLEVDTDTFNDETIPECTKEGNKSVRSYMDHFKSYISKITDAIDIASQLKELLKLDIQIPNVLLQRSPHKTIYDICMNIVSHDINSHETSSPVSQTIKHIPLPKKYKRVTSQSVLTNNKSFVRIFLECYELLLSNCATNAHVQDTARIVAICKPALMRVQSYIKAAEEKPDDGSSKYSKSITTKIIAKERKRDFSILPLERKTRKRKNFDFQNPKSIASHVEALMDSLVRRKELIENDDSQDDCGDYESNGNLRDKNRFIFRGSFMKGIQMLNMSGSLETSSYCALFAWELEQALFEAYPSDGLIICTQEYKAKARSLKFNLEDTKNPTLCARVFSGEIPMNKLVRMSVEEMSSNETKKERKQAVAKTLKDIVIAPSKSSNKQLLTTEGKKTDNEIEKKSSTDIVTNVSAQGKLVLSEMLDKASAAIASTNQYLHSEKHQSSDSPVHPNTTYDPDLITGSPSFSDNGESDIDESNQGTTLTSSVIQRETSDGQTNKNVIAKNGSQVFRISDGIRQDGPSFKCSLVYDHNFRNDSQLDHLMPETLVVSNRLHALEFNKFVQRKMSDPRNGWKVLPVRLSFTGVAR